MNKSLSLLAIIAMVLSALPTGVVRAAAAGDLIKCADFSSVYYLAEDGERYVFPNENIFYSWYADFSEVRNISCDDLAAIPMGDRLVYQEGTRLVKIPSDPSVFAVESDGVLREIPSEDIAEDLYGEDWELRVDDVSEAFWGSFTIGSPLVEGEIPEGTVLEDEDGNLFRMGDDDVVRGIDVVLDAEDEDVLREHALSTSEIEDRLGIALALLNVDADAAIDVLEDLLRSLRPVHVELEDEVEFEDVDEVETEASQMEDAEDAISDAEEEVAEAESDLAEDEADGRDVTESEVLLTEARVLLDQAEAALMAGDLQEAEDLADAADDKAKEAGGKAVEEMDGDDNDDEIESEDEDDSDSDSSSDDSDSDSTSDSSDSGSGGSSDDSGSSGDGDGDSD
jgi:hypothetical protein